MNSSLLASTKALFRSMSLSAEHPVSLRPRRSPSPIARKTSLRRLLGKWVPGGAYGMMRGVLADHYGTDPKLPTLDAPSHRHERRRN